MPLPNLAPLVYAILADTTATSTAPTPTPAEWSQLRDILINLGGWGAILWSLAWSTIRKVESFGNGITNHLAEGRTEVKQELRGFRRDLRRFRRELALFRRLHKSNATQRSSTTPTAPPETKS